MRLLTILLATLLIGGAFHFGERAGRGQTDAAGEPAPAPSAG